MTQKLNTERQGVADHHEAYPGQIEVPEYSTQKRVLDSKGSKRPHRCGDMKAAGKPR
jgi:hypothetical protein